MRCKKSLPVLVIVSCLVSCSRFNTPATLTAAQQLHTAAEACLLEVRDLKKTYEASGACTSLKQFSQLYTNAGGFLSTEPSESRLIGTEARLMAWQARAISASKDPGNIHMVDPRSNNSFKPKPLRGSA